MGWSMMQSWMTAGKPGSCLGSEPRGPNSMPGGWKKMLWESLEVQPQGYMAQVCWTGTPRARGFQSEGSQLLQKKGAGYCGINNQARRSGVTTASCALNLKEGLTQWSCRKKSSDSHWRVLLSSRIKPLYLLKWQLQLLMPAPHMHECIHLKTFFYSCICLLICSFWWC